MRLASGRFLFAFLAISTAAALLRPRLERPHLGLHLARTSFGWGGVTLMFASARTVK